MELSLMTFSMLMDASLKKIDAEILCQVAKENGLSSLDLMDFDLKIYGKEKLKEAMRRHGIHCGCLIMSASFFSAPGKVSGEIKEGLELARELGTDVLMVIPGQTTPADKAACKKMDKRMMLKYTVHHFRDAVEQAKPYGIKVGFENTPHSYKPLASAKDCKFVLQEVPGLGLIFDTGNFRVADTGCDELEIYEELKEYIIRVHLKDVAIGNFPNGEECVNGQKIQAVVTGSGVIQMEKLITKLREDGYDKGLAIEYAKPGDIHGMDNAMAVQPYCAYIRSAWEGKVLRPPYTKIEGIDIPVSRIFFGTAFMPMLMGKDVNALLDGAFSMGINAFDTARGYGMAEKSLGNWIKARNNRDKVVVLSKCGNVGLGGKVCVNRKVIEKELAKSLKTLNTDYIDIFLLHRDDPGTPVGEMIEALNDAKREGKIKIFGVSNWTHERIMEANAYAKEHDLEGFSVSSPNFGLAEQVNDPWGGECITISGPENDGAREWYAKEQMPVIAYSSLGRGFFSGRFASGDYEGAKKVMDGNAQKGYLCESNMKRLAVAEEMAKRDGCSVPQVAMRYIFSTPMNVFAVVSSQNVGRMRENVEAANMPLGVEDVEKLERPE